MQMIFKFTSTLLFLKLIIAVSVNNNHIWTLLVTDQDAFSLTIRKAQTLAYFKDCLKLLSNIYFKDLIIFIFYLIIILIIMLLHQCTYRFYAYFCLSKLSGRDNIYTTLYITTCMFIWLFNIIILWCTIKYILFYICNCNSIYIPYHRRYIHINNIHVI